MLDSFSGRLRSDERTQIPFSGLEAICMSDSRSVVWLSALLNRLNNGDIGAVAVA